MSSILARALKRHGGEKSATSRKSFFARRKNVFKSDGLGCYGRRRKRRRREGKEAGGDRIESFVEWCEDVGIMLHPNVYIGEEGSCDGIGVVAKEAIDKGECVALIPRHCLLSATNSKIKELIAQYLGTLSDSTSSWVPLLLALAAEYSSKSSSRWCRYLSVVPNDTNPLPMLWVESQRERLLEGTGVEEWVKMDEKRIRYDFETIFLPFMEQHPEIFRKALCSHQVYQKLVAFVMSYSFTDDDDDADDDGDDDDDDDDDDDGGDGDGDDDNDGDDAGLLGRTMMVPFVDLLNHASNHHVELTFHPRCLKLMAIRDIEKGEEVMNTYGELSNASLLHVYGFTEEDNPYDEALLSCELVKEVYLEHSPAHSGKWDDIDTMGILEEDYTIDKDGTPDVHLLMLTRLLHTKEEFKKISLFPDTLEDCSIEELDFLKRLSQSSLKGYPEQLYTQTPASCVPVTMKTRERHALRVTLGQQNSLRKLLSMCST